MQLVRERLMPADQRRRLEAQEAYRVRDLAGRVQFDQGLVEGNLQASLADACIDYAEGRCHRLRLAAVRRRHCIRSFEYSKVD